MLRLEMFFFRAKLLSRAVGFNLSDSIPAEYFSKFRENCNEYINYKQVRLNICFANCCRIEIGFCYSGFFPRPWWILSVLLRFMFVLMEISFLMEKSVWINSNRCRNIFKFYFCIETVFRRLLNLCFFGNSWKCVSYKMSTLSILNDEFICK